jgi:16S rRNA (guanine(966)-N(2))-methyltransferase RsmD
VREALFSIWTERIPESVFLDLFAGSGAVAVEAVSRGARHAVLVEGEDRATRALAETLRHLRVETLRLLDLRLPRGLADRRLIAEAPFDLVFADPPYRFTSYPALLQGIAPLLAGDGEVAIEHSGEVDLPPEILGRGAILIRREVRRYGGTRLSFYRGA